MLPWDERGGSEGTLRAAEWNGGTYYPTQQHQAG